MTVFAKDRKETAIKYIVIAQNLQVVLLRYIMNEKRVPKKWRYILVQDLVNKVSELLDNVVASNSIVPTDDEKLADRIKYMRCAVINCYQIENKLLAMVRVIPTVNADNLKEITGLIFDEIALLKKCIQNAKIVRIKKV